MPRSPVFTALALAALALVGCPAAPAEEAQGPIDPLYDPIRVGEVYVVRMDHGTPLTSRTQVEAKDAETVKVVTRIERAGSPVAPAESVLSRRRSPSELKVAALPSLETPLRDETLTVSGIAFPCRVSESQDPVAGKLTSWRCATRYPGLVKQVDASGKVVFELVEVVAPP